MLNSIFSHSVSRALCKDLIYAAFLISWITSGWLSSPINYCYIVNLSFPLKSVNVSFSTNFGFMQGHFLMPCLPYLTVCILFIFVIVNFQVSHKLVLPLNRVMVLRFLSNRDMDLLMLLLRVRTSFKCFLTRPLCYISLYLVQFLGCDRSKLKYKVRGFRGYSGIRMLGRFQNWRGVVVGGWELLSLVLCG